MLMHSKRIEDSAKRNHNMMLQREGIYNAMANRKTSPSAREAFTRKPFYLQPSSNQG